MQHMNREKNKCQMPNSKCQMNEFYLFILISYVSTLLKWKSMTLKNVLQSSVKI